MELKDAIKDRRSVRRYEDKRIPREVIKEIIDTARFYPSWENTKIARYYYIDDKDLIMRLANEGTNNFQFNMKTFESARGLMIFAYVKGRSGYERDGNLATSKGDTWEMFDSGIATLTFSLVAYNYGIGSCILGIFNEEKIKELLGLGDDLGISCIMTLGYPSENPITPRRKEVKDILNFVDNFVD